MMCDPVRPARTTNAAPPEARRHAREPQVPIEFSRGDALLGCRPTRTLVRPPGVASPWLLGRLTRKSTGTGLPVRIGRQPNDPGMAGIGKEGSCDAKQAS